MSSVVKYFQKAFTTEDTEATEQTQNEMELRRRLLVHAPCFTGQRSPGNRGTLLSVSVISVRSVVNDFLEGGQH